MKEALEMARLEELYAEFNDAAKIQRDPLAMVDRALVPGDFEVASFIVAGLSYGRVEQIQKSVENLWDRLKKLGLEANGAGIRHYLRESHNSADVKKALQGWSHRLNTAQDLAHLLALLAAQLRNHGSLCRLYQASFAVDPEKQLQAFCENFLAGVPEKIRTTSARWSGTGPAWFASAPASGSTCKRLMMWLRWMIRKDFIDPGIWQLPELHDTALPLPRAERLFLPVDTHIFRWARHSKILKRKSANWAAVREITAYFKRIRPDDPLRYDFALCHTGMLQFRDSQKKLLQKGR